MDISEKCSSEHCCETELKVKCDTSEQVFVAFDTSNYTTSIAVADGEGKMIANLKSPLPVAKGERGLRQSDAVFAHIKNLPDLCDRLSSVIIGKRVAAVGYSACPRDAEGSYMPCFLSGKTAAHAFASGVGVPYVFPFSHQSGHITAALYSSGCMDFIKEGRKFLAFHVSGGTTEALLVDTSSGGVNVRLVGETADINAGQLIDRIGVKLGLSFPCGIEMEKLASKNTMKLPKPRITVKNGVCNLSGAENLALSLFEKEGSAEQTAAYVFEFVADTLMQMTKDLISAYGDMPVVFAGGVMSNKLMRAKLSSVCDAHFACPEYSSDNACGVAILTYLEYLKNGKQ